MVQLIPLNIKDEDSIEYILSNLDNCIQYGEDLEPKEPKELYEDDEADQEFAEFNEFQQGDQDDF